MRPRRTASSGTSPIETFKVRFPGNAREYTWKIGKLVTDYGVTEFGSQQDDDPKSKPIATKTYDVLWLIDMPDGGKQLCVFTNARTGIKPTENFFSTAKAKGVDHFFQKYRIVAAKKTGPTGDPYFTYQYEFVDYLSDADSNYTAALYKQYSKSGFVTDLEGDPVADEKPVRQRSQAQKEADESSEIPF